MLKNIHDKTRIPTYKHTLRSLLKLLHQISQKKRAYVFVNFLSSHFQREFYFFYIGSFGKLFFSFLQKKKKKEV